MRSTFSILIAAVLFSGAAGADAMDDEIDYLIHSVGRDGCAFVRNGRRLSGRDARAHLESKRDLNAKIFTTTEQFIARIASKSVTTGDPYLIRCRGEGEKPARVWFTELLKQHRSSRADTPDLP